MGVRGSCGFEWLVAVAPSRAREEWWSVNKINLAIPDLEVFFNS